MEISSITLSFPKTPHLVFPSLLLTPPSLTPLLFFQQIQQVL
ncbi:hypothetical protein OIU84_006580 [Salix udensis]|uniref:Uncharacterized protein n=1 Tax=Salix udensis TaxID=889485 RepID=A0AAD6P297_9ROSI|nr:hypothetical protein OIU84_006580 [Salix udensis]